MTTDRVDWFRVFADLNRAGVSGREVARLTGLAWATVWSYANSGTEPRFHEGDVIAMLWCEKTGKPPAELPRIESSAPRYRARAH